MHYPLVSFGIFLLFNVTLFLFFRTEGSSRTFFVTVMLIPPVLKKKKRLRFHLGKTGLIKDVTKIGKLAELSLSPKSWS